MWDLTGRKLFNFEGHEAPVYSVCPHQKENIQVKVAYPLVGILLCTKWINVVLLLGFPI